MFQALLPGGGKAVRLQRLLKQDPDCCLDEVQCPETSGQCVSPVSRHFRGWDFSVAWMML